MPELAGEARRGLREFLRGRVLVMLALGFSAGLPNLLIFDTLSAWLRDAGISLALIGFFSLATLAYSAKFLWAPLVDRSRIPALSGWLGHRRSWMLASQLAIIVGLWLISGQDPATSLGTMAAFAVLVGFAGATQDIVIDAWRIEAAEPSQQGIMAAAYQWGYRIAIIVAGAAPLALAEIYDWSFSYAAMAGLMAVGIAAVLAAPREQAHRIRPIHAEGVIARPASEALEWLVRGALLVCGGLVSGAGLAGSPAPLALVLGADVLGLAPLWRGSPWSMFLQAGAVALGLAIIALACAPVPGLRTRPGLYLGASFGAPLRDFFERHAGTAGLILALICLYRVSDFVLNVMNPFYLDLGFSKIEIAEVRKVFGVAASVLGVFIGGWAVVQWGLMKSLIIGAFAGSASNLVFIGLAMAGHSVPALFVAIGIDNVASGFAGTCLIAYMSSLTSSGFTATQYALFSSLYALPGKLVASQSGRIIEAVAKSANDGGLFAALTPLLANATSNAYVASAGSAKVAPAALGAGYIAFFLYSALIGVAAIVLTFIVAARTPAAAARAEAGD
jgi:MFS transporter, PAT family, beta-lactamase induction signal transducer AmpG